MTFAFTYQQSKKKKFSKINQVLSKGDEKWQRK
jgi:hypothetical protein